MFVFNQWVLKIITSTLRTNMNPPLIDDIQFTSSPASFFATFSKADLEKKKGFEKIAVGSLVDDKIKICFSIHTTHPQALTSTYFTDIFHMKKPHMCISTQGRVRRLMTFPPTGLSSHAAHDIILSSSCVSIGPEQLEFSFSLLFELLTHVRFFCNCTLPGSFVSGISQARILEWVASPFSIELLSYSPVRD